MKRPGRHSAVVIAFAALALVNLTAAPLWAGSGSLITFPMVGVKPKSGLRLTIDGRGVDANGYRPVKVSVAPLTPGAFGVDRQLRVVLSPADYSRSSWPRISQIIELPEDATSVETTIAVPQCSNWQIFGLNTYEGGERLKDLSAEYVGWGTSNYWGWTEASPTTLFIDDRVPPRAQRDNQVGLLQTQGTDPTPTYDLPDIRTLAWIFPDPNRNNTGWAAALTPGTGIPAAPQLSDTTLLMQIQTQMGRIEMLPLAELPQRWIDLSQYDVVVISTGDLASLAGGKWPKELEALRQWLQGGTTLIVYDAGNDFARLAEIEKHLQLGELPEVADEEPHFRGWTPADPNRHNRELQVTWDARQAGYTSPWTQRDQPYINYQAEMSAVQATGRNGSGMLPAPAKPPFLHRPAGLGVVVAISAAKPFPGSDTDWYWVFNCVPTNHWAWYQRNGFSQYRQNTDYWTFLIPGVGRAPAISFLLLVSLFAALIGPVNYMLLGRARRLYLLLVTVPAGAAIVAVCLFAYAIITDGLGVRLRARSFAEIDQTTGAAAGWSRQSYFASIAPSRGFEYPDDCTIFEIAHRPANGNQQQSGPGHVLLWDGRQHLQSGYINSRTGVQYMVQRSTTTNQRLVIQEGKSAGQPPRVENRLGVRIRQLLVRDRRGDYYAATDLAPEDQATLIKADPAAVQQDFVKLARDVQLNYPTGYDPTSQRKSLIAYLKGENNYWGGVDGGSPPPQMNTSLLETNLSRALRPEQHPPQPRTYTAIVESSPIVPVGTPGLREEASLNVVRGRY